MYMYIHNRWMCIYTEVQLHVFLFSTYTYVYIPILYIHIYIYIYMHTYLYLHSYIHIYVYTYTYLYMYTHMYIYKNIYIHKHIYTLTTQVPEAVAQCPVCSQAPGAGPPFRGRRRPPGEISHQALSWFLCSLGLDRCRDVDPLPAQNNVKYHFALVTYSGYGLFILSGSR